MFNKKLWQIREKECKLFYKKQKAKRPQRQMTMEGFWRPVIQDEYSAVRQPVIEANNFEL